MRNFTTTHSLTNLRNVKNENQLKAYPAFVVSVISLITLFLSIKHVFKDFLLLRFLKANKMIATLLMSIVAGLYSNVAFAQNAPDNFDKYYMLVGELVSTSGSNVGQTDVYQYTTGAGITSCSLVGGGGEGMVVDKSKNVAYIATCCDKGEVRIYDYNSATFLTPIKLVGEDILDVALSIDNSFLYVGTYNKLYKINTTTNAVVGSISKSSLKNTAAQDFWGVAAHPSNGRIFVSTNWKNGSGASTIESIDANVSSSILIATAPTGFHYRGIVFDASGNLWAVAAHDNSTTKDKLYKYSATGTLLASYDFVTPTVNGGGGVGKVNPFDLAFGPDDNLYITTFAGDCVTKFNVSNNSFSTYLQYVAGSSAKSITFVGGNFKCICTAPVINQANISKTAATCNGATNNRGVNYQIL